MNRHILTGFTVFLLVALLAGGYYFRVTNEKKPRNTQLQSLPTAQPTLHNMKIENEATAASSAAKNVNTKDFTIVGTNYKFTPATLKVKKGDIVRIAFQNKAGLHDFAIDEFNIQTQEIGEGNETEIRFTADKAGTFEYYCSVGNHRARGMKGKLVVE